VDQELLAGLAKYITVLAECADRTHRAEDRPMYAKHLAAAARMLPAIQEGARVRSLASLVADEKRAFGWSYLSDAEGDAAERAFGEFADLVESKHRE
jgi:hypothetical protein